MTDLSIVGAVKAKPPRLDPSLQIIACELSGCEKSMTLADSYSFIGGIATTGPSHVSAFQCPDEQHFACCLEHALLLHFLCLRDHVVPTHQAREQMALAAHQPALEAPNNG